MKILKHQLWHLISLLLLLYGINYFLNTDQSFHLGEFIGLNTSVWFIIAILSPIIHQIYVVVCWRYELFYKGLTNTIGASAFKLYKIGFAILILSRVVTIILLALSNKETISGNPNFYFIVAGVISIPAIYLFYSLKRYFGIDRAFGIDHFKPEEVKNNSFVKKGIFRFTSNGMYVYGFLLLWIPGLLFQSKAALLAALFNHIYIWVHYYFTELPDIKFIYGNDKK